MYQVTCALMAERYKFKLYKDQEPVVPEIEAGDVIIYSAGEVIVIEPTALVGLDPDWGKKPGWWVIDVGYVGLAASGPFGDDKLPYAPPVPLTLPDGKLQITAGPGTAKATYDFFLQINVTKSPSGAPTFPPGSVIIWDPELQNTGT